MGTEATLLDALRAVPGVAAAGIEPDDRADGAGTLRLQLAPGADEIAVATSKEDPDLRWPAGARLTVIRRSHLKSKPQLRRAERTLAVTASPPPTSSGRRGSR